MECVTNIEAVPTEDRIYMSVVHFIHVSHFNLCFYHDYHSYHDHKFVECYLVQILKAFHMKTLTYKK